jgi:hypothetical protein
MKRDLDVILATLARIEAKLDAGFEKIATKDNVALLSGSIEALSRQLDSPAPPQA